MSGRGGQQPSLFLKENGGEVIEFRVENIKRIRAVTVSVGPSSVVQIAGRNGQGKTSFMDAVGWLFGGAKQIEDTDPIRVGQDTATIEGRVGPITIRRTFRRAEDESGKKYRTTLTVTGDGAKYNSPQQLLDETMDALAYDPVEFMRSGPAKQFDMLRRFVPEFDFAAHDKAQTEDRAKRAEINVELRRKKAAAEAVVVANDLPAEKIDEAALLAQMQSAAQVNSEIERERLRRENLAQADVAELRKCEEWRTRAQQLRLEADRLDAEADRVEAEVKRMVADLASLPPLAEPVDTADIVKQIERARQVNAQIDLRDQRAALEAAAGDLLWESEALTEALEAREAKKAKAIRDAQMPVPGLSLAEGQVLYNGVPLSQASGRDQIIISTSIAAATNPGLRLIRIRDGNGLDEDGMAILAELAREKGCMVLVERVVSADGVVSFVIEDGEVKEHRMEF